MTQFRQGDIFLVAVDTIPRTAKPVPRDDGRVVLAYGEATGHAHALRDAHVELLEAPATTREPAARRYLRLVKPARLLHEEHAPIELPAGKYRVVRQREYSPERTRYVAD